MRTDRVFCVIIGCLIQITGICWGLGLDGLGHPDSIQDRNDIRKKSENLSSASVSHCFVELAQELAQAGEDEQAIIFVLAAKELNTLNDEAHQLFLDLASQWPSRDYSEYVLDWMTRPANQMGDFDVFRQSLDYVLSKQRTRKSRDQLLESLGNETAIQNPFFISEIRMLQGMSALDSMDTVNAQTFFTEAYNENKYNKNHNKYHEVCNSRAEGPIVYNTKLVCDYFSYHHTTGATNQLWGNIISC